MLNAALRDYFPDEDYRFYLRVGQMPPADFFKPTAAHAQLIAERKQNLREHGERCLASVPGAEPLLCETLALAREWGTIPPDAEAGSEICRTLGESWEVDFLLLKPDERGEARLLGGCVCFPSSWALEEKVGHPLPFIHEAVPGLNAALQSPITTFLKRLRPGIAFTRWNWGLSRHAQLNQHPALNLAKLAPPLRLDDVWLRLEDQALVALLQSGGVLFGIRIWVVPLAQVKADAETARRLHRALRTMPDEVARYKNLLATRGELLRLLEP
ncbi:MAG: DUF3445 domain-containing protein [Verrucomicrobia bacterium]|nr:DUF3445 domain-containing protein [Verrucomicrobiota bacterium]